MSAAPSAADVANILIFVVPGFFARIGYRARFPQRDQQPTFALVVSVALSLPLVAVADEIADLAGIATESTDSWYALLLVALGLLAGYLAASLRAANWFRKVLAYFKMPFPPEATIYEQTVLKMPAEGLVTVVFKDGRIVCGFPAIGPTYVEPGEAREMYLVAPRGFDQESGEWIGVGNGMVVNLAEIEAVTLDSDPLEDISKDDDKQDEKR